MLGLLLLLLMVLLLVLVGRRDVVDGIVMGQIVQLLHETRRAGLAVVRLLLLMLLAVVRSAAQPEVGHHVGQTLEQFAGRALLTTAANTT